MNRKATLITFGTHEYGKARDVPKEFTQIRLDFKGHCSAAFSSVSHNGAGDVSAAADQLLPSH